MSIETTADGITCVLDDGDDPLDMMLLGILIGLRDGPMTTLQLRRKLGLQTHLGRRKLSARLAEAARAGQVAYDHVSRQWRSLIPND